MKREDVRERIEEIGIIPAVRITAAHFAPSAPETVNKAGIPVAEITMTIPGAVDLIAQLAGEYPDFIVGAGTVLDTETTKRCFDASARFLTSPGFAPEVVEFAVRNAVVIIPGALTPSEVIAAWKAGGFRKSVSLRACWRSKYIRALKVPLPQVRFIAAGGVDQVTASGFIHAGASALGIGSELLPAGHFKCARKNGSMSLLADFSALCETPAHS